ncbi:MAG: HAD family hydrolase [Ruminococcus sp.]|nr:HAD family hydrolase [Ruminococcus sp.]
MAITTVLFDLDGTLLPMDQEVFIKHYFMGLSKKFAQYGYDPSDLSTAVWGGTKAMIKNTGERSNEDVFWDAFVAVYGERVLQDKHHFDEFYYSEFQDIKNICGHTEKSAAILRAIKDAGMRVALATNPIFPSIATESRIRWAGLEPEDFELYTTYENINYCKPNPEYYLEVTRRMGVSPEECLMVGNDVSDDMCARKLGMEVFLLTDCLINHNNEDISQYPHGGFDALFRFLGL